VLDDCFPIANLTAIALRDSPDSRLTGAVRIEARVTGHLSTKPRSVVDLARFHNAVSLAVHPLKMRRRKSPLPVHAGPLCPPGNPPVHRKLGESEIAQA
jgi:hypothetical protein